MKNDSLSRVSVPELEGILGHTFPVLDDGFIRLIDYMGSDESIVQAARVSYGKGTRKLNEDRGLIRYLMRHSHTTPFEMCEIKMHVRVPMDCWRQWIRHRTANVNEYSTRYSIAIDATQKTRADTWRKQSPTNKQGSDSYLEKEVGQHLSERESELHRLIRENYEERINLGVAREQARKDLPLSTYTEAYWKIDLHNLFHFLELRMDSHAQYEIRSYANVIGTEFVSKWCPLAWEAFSDYRLNSMRLSQVEVNILKLLVKEDTQDLKNYLLSLNLISIESGKIKLSREAKELFIKLERLGVNEPWDK
jgi:thymidylate synthase (FAD)